jgi:hypothetical protein
MIAISEQCPNLKLWKLESNANMTDDALISIGSKCLDLQVTIIGNTYESKRNSI